NRAGIVAFRDVSEVAKHGWTQTAHVDRVHAELLEDVIALNVAEDHRRARFRGVFFELKQHGALTAWHLEEVVDRALQRRGQGRGHARVHLFLHTHGHRRDEFLQRRRGREDNLPTPEDILGTGHQITREYVISGPLREPAG